MRPALILTTLAVIATATIAPTAEARRLHGGATRTIILPGDGVFPEGVAATGERLYVTSAGTGAIFTARVGAQTAAVLSPAGTDGRTAAIGVKVDRRNDQLVVAGGAAGSIWLVDRRTGATRGVFANGLTQGTFVNDIAIARNGDVYATDSFRPVIYRIAAADLAGPATGGTLETWLDLTGSPVVFTDGAFNNNGIVVAGHGRHLIVAQANVGKLWRIDTETKAIAEIPVSNGDITGADGLVLARGRLIVVNSGAVDVLRLNADHTAATVKRTIEDATFDSPTTAALRKGRLYVVNSQFGKGPSAAAPFTVSVVRLGHRRR